MATNNNAYFRYAGNTPSQETRRSTAVWFDQHKDTKFRDASGAAIFENGRPYYSIIELESRMPCGPVMPLGWEAPYYAPQMYLLKSIGRITHMPQSVVTEGLAKNIVTDRIRLDYEQMLRDDTEATNAHWRLAVAEAASRDWTVPRLGQPMDRRLLAIVGPAPRSPMIAKAFLAGDPWILGQLMPSYFDERRGRMVVEENEALARVIAMNRDDVLTPEQAEAEELRLEAEEQARREATAGSGDLKALLAEALEQNAKLAQLLAEKAAEKAAVAAKRGPGRPPKAPKPPTPVAG